jgi:hypothetical protein
LSRLPTALNCCSTGWFFVLATSASMTLLRYSGSGRIAVHRSRVRPAFIPTSDVASPSKIPWTTLPEANAAVDG